MKVIIGFFAVVAGMGCYALVKQAGRADKSLEEIWRAESLRKENAANGD